MIPQGLSFAKRFDGITGSAIREIFKIASQPGMISFAGGNPAAEALPDTQCAEIAGDVLRQDGKRILQYGATEGYPPFLESLQDYVSHLMGADAPRETLLPITGSTQGMYLLCSAFLNPGDTVLVESPTFLGNMQILRLTQSRLISVESDEYGMIPKKLEQAVLTHRPKMLYTIPTFQNPSGLTLEAGRREAVAQLAEKYGFLVVEDDPYKDLRYTGSPLLPIKSFDRSGHVAYMGSFSKTISPGLRVGYLVAQEDILRKCAIGKQSADLHTPALTQAIVDQYLRRGILAPHIQAILPGYREKMNRMLEALSAFPPGFRYTCPEGGLFIFVTLPENLDAALLLKGALEKNVAYVPGTHFFPNGGHENTLRLNFSNSTTQQIGDGMAILRELFTRY
ncbi:MAG: PLP-dependent aminotransferase family protein [Clostridia bacterium]|nr:PLP-dependent aminotransferase family protein [Clostridia bacterium]